MGPKKSRKITHLADWSDKAKYAGVPETLQLAAQKVVDGSIKASKIIVILDHEGREGVHLFSAGIDTWDGIAMCEQAKAALMFEEAE